MLDMPVYVRSPTHLAVPWHCYQRGQFHRRSQKPNKKITTKIIVHCGQVHQHGSCLICKLEHARVETPARLHLIFRSRLPVLEIKTSSKLTLIKSYFFRPFTMNTHCRRVSWQLPLPSKKHKDFYFRQIHQ